MNFLSQDISEINPTIDKLNKGNYVTTILGRAFTIENNNDIFIVYIKNFKFIYNNFIYI